MKNRLPKICRRKDRNLAFITLDGNRIYLGAYGSDAAAAEYKKVISDYLLGVKKSRSAQQRTTIAELASEFLAHAKSYYVKNGKTTKQCERYCAALAPVLKLYGTDAITDFDSLKLEEVQRDLETSGRYCRPYINQLISCIRAVFKWGVKRKIVPPAVLVELQSVEHLKFKRSIARESRIVKPVDWSQVEKTLPFLSSPVAAMVRVQALCGCRPGEICEMRACDLDRSGRVWTYRPLSWKTEHLNGEQKRIAIGPKAQAILTPFLIDREEDPNAFLFSPRDAWIEYARDLREKRKTRVQPSQQKRNEQRRIKINDRLNAGYNAGSYSHAVAKAAKKAGAEHWSPNQLRHLAATRVREAYGLEAAQCLLGHARADVTQIYAERNYQQAVKIADEIG